MIDFYKSYYFILIKKYKIFCIFLKLFLYDNIVLLHLLRSIIIF